MVFTVLPLDVQWKLFTSSSNETSNGTDQGPQQQQHYEAENARCDKLLNLLHGELIWNKRWLTFTQNRHLMT